MNKHHKFKTGLFISVLMLIVVIAICGQMYGTATPGEKKHPSEFKIDIALLTDSAGVEDDSYNQYSYQGLKRYCKDENVKYKVFTPKTPDSEDCLSSVDDAVKMGAKLIVCSSPNLSETVYQAQDRYSDVSFILVDCMPSSSDGYITKVTANVTSLVFDDDESGFIAGYASVISGYKDLAILYDSENITDVHYYYGFVQGAEYAAKEIDGNVKIKVRDICGQNEKYPARMARRYYSKGTDLILTCNQTVCKMVNSQAKKYEGAVVINAGSNMNKYKAVAGSVVKNIEEAVYLYVKTYSEGDDLESQDVVTFDAKNNAVCFEPNDKVLDDFNMEKYKMMYKLLSNGEIVLISDTTVSIEDLELTKVTVKEFSHTDS